MILLLLAAGRGCRMKEYTDDINKCLLHVNGIPIIYYSLKKAEESSVTKAIVVIGYQAAKVKASILQQKWSFPIQFVYQEEQKGIVHAMQKAFPLINTDEDILLNLGDEILIRSNIPDMIKDFYKYGSDFVCGAIYNCNIRQIQKAYSITLNSRNQITKVLEKPVISDNGICGTGYCIFKYKTLKYLSSVPLNTVRNQYELCDFINILIKHGNIGYAYKVGQNLINVNTIQDLNFIYQELQNENLKN